MDDWVIVLIIVVCVGIAAYFIIDCICKENKRKAEEEALAEEAEGAEYNPDFEPSGDDKEDYGEEDEIRENPAFGSRDDVDFGRDGEVSADEFEDKNDPMNGEDEFEDDSGMNSFFSFMTNPFKNQN